MAFLFFVLFVCSAAFSCYVLFFLNTKIVAENNKREKENQELRERFAKENQELRTKGQVIWEENQRLAKWKPIINAEEKAKEILANAMREIENRRLEAVRIASENQSVLHSRILALQDELEAKQIKTKRAIAAYDLQIQEWGEKSENAYKEYKYRKTLPESHEKLKTKFEELQAKCDQLIADLKEAKAANKGAKLDVKDREKIVAQFDKLGRSYVEDTFKFIVSKMTTNNFTASRDRVLKTIGSCRAMGFDWPENMEEEYTEKIREEFKRALRIEEMRLEQQRIKEQIREEQKVLRELEALKKKEEQAIKERQEAEQAREAMKRAIDEALAQANGEHTVQILEMEKALAEKDQEIVAKQQEIDDNQRAISNAQITKAGHVYVLSNIGSFGDGVFKIGMTRRSDPQERVDELGGAAVPFPFDVHIMVGTDNAPELEKTLHRKFNDMRLNRVNLRKEYFRVSIDDVQHEMEMFLGKKVEYRANPLVFEEYAEQYRQSQQTTLADIEEVESLYHEASIDSDD